MKDYEAYRKHFIERLKERYSIEISDEKYNYYVEKFQGKFKKDSRKTIGFIFISDVKVWCLYFNDLKVLATCYPPEIETDIQELIHACLPISLRHIAIYIYDCYVHERNYLKIQFGSNKQAAKYYYSHTMFPSLHMMQFIYKSVDLFAIINKIKDIIFFRDGYCSLSLRQSIGADIPKCQIKNELLALNGVDA